jgi:hypothetical protein
MITGKRKYKKRGPYKTFSALFYPQPIQLKITAGTIKLALTPGRPKYLGQHSALSALLKKYVYKKLDKISYENLKAFRVLFLSSLKNNTYHDSIDKLDSLSFFVSFFFFKFKIISKLFHISNKIIIVNPKALLISDIHLVMLHEHLKFIQKKTERGTLRYVIHGEVVKYGGHKLDTKPIFLDKEESINVFGYAAYHKIMEKTDDYGRTARIYINHAKILTTTKQS